MLTTDLLPSAPMFETPGRFFGFAVTAAPKNACLASRSVHARWSLPRSTCPVVKFQFGGPNTDQAVVHVARKSMKSKENSLRLSGKATHKTSLTVSGMSDEWSVVAVYTDERR